MRGIEKELLYEDPDAEDGELEFVAEVRCKSEAMAIAKRDSRRTGRRLGRYFLQRTQRLFNHG
jgi:hypothetical protein